jgi:hypothetical protein
MKAKIMDYDTDWERIKNTELAFLAESDLNVGIDHRFSQSGKDTASNQNVDRRETILRALVSVAAFN